MANWEDIEFSTVRTGDIDKAEITINKYRVEDGEAIEEEEDVNIGEEELEEIRSEMSSKVQEALDEFDEKGEVTSFDVDLGDETDVSTEAESDAQSDSGDTTTEPSTEEQSEEPAAEEDMEEAIEIGRSIAADQAIGKNDYGNFASAMGDEGYSNPSFVSDVWGVLRDDGTIGDDGGPEPDDDETEEEQSPGDRDPVEVGREVVESGGLTTSDWPTFAKEMREAGVPDQDTHSEVWDQLKREGVLGAASQADTGGGGDEPQHPSGMEEDEFAIPPGNDLLMMQSDEQASEMVLSTLNEAVQAEDVIAIPITSELGKAIIEPMDPDVTTPFYLETTEDGFINHPLEKLVEKYE